MQELYELKEKLMNELTEYAKKKDMSAGSLDVIDKMAHALKNLDKVIEKSEEEGYSSEGSYRGMSHRSYGMYSRDGEGSYNSYEGSYARGRGRGAARDSMGRYSSEGYSGHDMVGELKDLMHDVPDERTRQSIQRLIQKMEQ